MLIEIKELLELISKNTIWLYNSNIDYIGHRINVKCNNFFAYSWLYQLTYNTYSFTNNKIDLEEYNIFCNYSHENYNKVALLLSKYKFEEIMSHHKDKAKLYRQQDYYIIWFKETGTIFMRKGTQCIVLIDSLQKNSYVELSRFVREIFTRLAEKENYYLIHASAVERNGEIFVITGDKGAGKTTSLLELIEEGYNIVSNDRIFLGINGESLYCFTWPGAVAVSVKFLEKYSIINKVVKELKNSIYPQQRIKNLDLFIRNPIEYSKKYPEEKMDLSCEELSNIFKIKNIASGKVKKIVAIYVNGTTEKCIDKLFLYPEDPSYPNWLLLGERKSMVQEFEDVKNKAKEICCNVEMKHDDTDQKRLKKAFFL